MLRFANNMQRSVPLNGPAAESRHVCRCINICFKMWPFTSVCLPTGHVHQVNIWRPACNHRDHRRSEYKPFVFLIHLHVERSGRLVVSGVTTVRWSSVGWLWLSDCGSLSAPQSLADRCKKIHAGDEVIQVNHQTVVRLQTLLPGYFYVFFMFPAWICIWIFFFLLCNFLSSFAYYLCKCLFSSHMFLLCGYPATIAHMLWKCMCLPYTLSLLRTVDVAVYPHRASAAPLDLSLYKWLHVVPLLAGLWRCGCATLYFVHWRVRAAANWSHWTCAYESTSVPRGLPV